MMGLFRKIEERASAGGFASVWERDVEGPMRRSAAGVNVTPETARRMAAVWSCQSLLADGVASLPIDVYRRVKKTGRRELLDTPPAFEQPNAHEDIYAFLHKAMISLVGQDGNAFIFHDHDKRGNLLTMRVLDPRMVQIDENSPEPLYTVGDPNRPDVSRQTFGPDQIMHIPAFTVPGRRRGLSVIDYAAESIGLGLAAEEFGSRFFSQGTTMAGVVTHPGTPKPGEVAILRQMLRKSHSGTKNSHAVGILTGGATWTNISVTPEQAQFLETRRFQSLQIAQLYRVPPHMVDPTVQSSWGSGVEEQNQFFVDFTLVPWLVRLERALSALLPLGQRVKFNVDARLRASTAERYQAHRIAFEMGMKNLDEIRESEDMEPIPGGKGKKFYVTANVKELGEKPEPAAKPVAAAPDVPPEADPNAPLDGAPDVVPDEELQAA